VQPPAQPPAHPGGAWLQRPAAAPGRAPQGAGSLGVRLPGPQAPPPGLYVPADGAALPPQVAAAVAGALAQGLDRGAAEAVVQRFRAAQQPGPAVGSWEPAALLGDVKAELDAASRAQDWDRRRGAGPPGNGRLQPWGAGHPAWPGQLPTGGPSHGWDPDPVPAHERGAGVGRHPQAAGYSPGAQRGHKDSQAHRGSAQQATTWEQGPGRGPDHEQGHALGHQAGRPHAHSRHASSAADGRAADHGREHAGGARAHHAHRGHDRRSAAHASSGGGRRGAER